jgi:hypothetical protein
MSEDVFLHFIDSSANFSGQMRGTNQLFVCIGYWFLHPIELKLTDLLIQLLFEPSLFFLADSKLIDQHDAVQPLV